MQNEFTEAARARQDQLTKPPGSLGALEEVAIQLAGIQRRERPASRPAHALVFAADHPVVKHGVSAYPASVTGAMMSNFGAGGAASTAFASELGIEMEVVDVGVESDYVPAERLRREAVAERAGGDLRTEDALDEETLHAALEAGKTAVDRLANDVRVLVLGEMGIGNTTPAAAIVCSLLGRDAHEIVGPGTGVAGNALANKRAVVADALERAGDGLSGEEALRALGGREIAAIAGAALRAHERGICVLVDGFIVSAAILAAVRMRPELRASLLFGHRSGEPGHTAILEALDARPLLDLGLRLGEGTGALCALPLLDLACAMHRDMATFAEAAVEGPV